MPRFESEDRFWEIEREGRILRIRSGRIGEAGDDTQRSEHFVAVAKRQFDEAIAAKLAEGYVQVEDVGLRDFPRNESLERRLLEELDPDSEGEAAIAWAVLGDWLDARGDVRGQLIAIDEALRRFDELAGAGGSELERSRLEAHRDRLLREWVPKWIGDLAHLCGKERPLEVTWDHGWMAGLRLGTLPGRLDLSSWRLGIRDLVPVLEQVLEHPLAGLLRKLVLAELDPRGRRDYGQALAVLAAQPRRALIRLELGALTQEDWVRDVNGSYKQRTVLTRAGFLEPLAELERWAPRLRALRIIGRQLGPLPPMPQLRALELQVPTLTVGLRSSLANNPWPKLERLWLRCTDVYDPWSREQLGSGAELRRLLCGLAGPLRELGVQGPTALVTVLEFIDELELRALRLPRLSEPAARLLLEQAGRLDSVEHIVLEDASCDPSWPELRARFGARIVSLRGAFAELEQPDGPGRWLPDRVWRG